ncbi:MAG: hypothetical protein AB4206_00335 [Xenococcaceae cyanobacterium]
MISKKYLSILLICLTIVLITVPKIFASPEEQCIYHTEAYEGLEMNRLSRELKTTGLIGRIHGSVGTSKLFVMSVREPDNFFSYREFSLLPKNKQTLATLSQVNRHDRVCIRGHIISNPSPQKHIAVKSVEVLESWTGLEGFPEQQREANIPAELLDRNSFIGKVHAIGEEGKILVMEYKDGVIPVFVKSPEYTKDLYRGDIVRLSYQLKKIPKTPTHLKLDSQVEQPVEVVDAITDWNDKENTLTGNLVKFPQSPQLNFDVYALEVDTLGIKRYFTLVNFEDIDEFKNIRNKLAQIWDEKSETAEIGRNMLINREITIEAHGTTSIISPRQANPQILLGTAEDIQQKS